MRWYGASTLLWGHSFNQICEQLSEANLEGVELWTEQFWHERFTVSDVLKNISKYNLDISLHAACWDLNISSLNDEIRRQSIKEIEKSIELAEALQVPSITIHPGRLTLTDKWTTWHTNCLQKSLDELEEVAQQSGVTLSIELMELAQKEFVTSPRLLNELVDHRSKFVTTTFDVAHIPLTQSPKKLLEDLHRVDKVHISDSTKKQFHVPLGEGEIDILHVMQTLKVLDVPIVIEGFDYLGKDKMLETNLRFLQKNNLLRKVGMSI